MKDLYKTLDDAGIVILLILASMILIVIMLVTLLPYAICTWAIRSTNKLSDYMDRITNERN